MQWEEKLRRVMARLQARDWNWDHNRFGAFVEFHYGKGYYRLEQSVSKAIASRAKLKPADGRECFAQIVLGLEDLARLSERGIYDLGVWVEGLKALPAGSVLAPCFVAMEFTAPPRTKDEVNAQYHNLAKTYHPDAGGSENAWRALEAAYKQCLEQVSDGRTVMAQ